MRTDIEERILIEPGYRQAYTPAGDTAVSVPRLRNVRVGQRLRAQVRITRRPLTEADLVRLMQQHGIGRPSTYAATIASLRRHRYVDENLAPTPRGLAALEWLTASYPRLFALDFSAALEGWLDDLAAGQRSYRQVVAAVWAELAAKEQP